MIARIGRIALLAGRWQDELFRRLGVNRGEVGVLTALMAAGTPARLSPSRLLKMLMLSSAGITSRLDRLEQRGLISRVADPDDRRGVLIELTENGEQLAARAVAAYADSQKDVLGSLDEQELQTLERLLRKLQTALEGPGAVSLRP